jgi:predicted nucleotidyltransferase
MAIAVKSSGKTALREALELLRDRRTELERNGIVHLAVFGSLARGDDRPDSDVDLLVTIAPGAPIGLLELVRLSRRLEELLGRKVDLAEPAALKPNFRARVLKEQIVAF